VKDWIPDLPSEYFRLYKAAMSDAIRYALIYHHGGMYIDSDFLVLKNMTPIVQQLYFNDLVSYEVGWQRCKANGAFSSNFVGGRKGSQIHKAIWEAQKLAMTDHCVRGDRNESRVCCYDSRTDACHVPWARLGEGVAHPVMRKFLRRAERPKTFCFGGENSFAPDKVEGIFSKNMAVKDALETWKEVPKPLDRIMYHMFNSMYGLSDFTQSELFDNNTMIGHLYVRSFNSDQVPQLPQAVPQRPPRRNLTTTLSRFEFATRPTVRQEECGGFDEQASSPSPNGMKYAWCRRVLRKIKRKTEHAMGLSYGDTSKSNDRWMQSLLDEYSVPNVLHDCLTAKPTWLDKHRFRQVCISVVTSKDRFGRRMERLSGTSSSHKAT